LIITLILPPRQLSLAAAAACHGLQITFAVSLLLMLLLLTSYADIDAADVFAPVTLAAC